MSFSFVSVGCPDSVDEKDWNNWKWQLKHLSLRQIHSDQSNLKQSPYLEKLQLNKDPLLQDRTFLKTPKSFFMSGTTPYYLRLMDRFQENNLPEMIQPSEKENLLGLQSMEDPLGEEDHSPVENIIHRYPDRVIFLVTDTCGVYCRFCTRKRYTGQKQAFISKREYKKSLEYIKKNTGIREVILSGGDPLTLSDSLLNFVLENLRSIDHIEIIRIGSRMPVVCPMRLTSSLIKMFKKYNPLFLMTHFNHPDEIVKESADKLSQIADSGILMFNQTVMLNGINNDPALLQALSRRLLYLRVKPYYLFQCDPSRGTDHFRNSIKDSSQIQRELWGRLSGLSLPSLSVDIPEGGGKAPVTPHFLQKIEKEDWIYKGWDGRVKTYKNPKDELIKKPKIGKNYQEEWNRIKNQKYGKNRV